MENLGKQAGYLKGLLEGAALEAERPDGKLLAGVVELLGALSGRVEQLGELYEDLNDYVQSIDDDLTELENDRDAFDDLEGEEDDGFGDFEELGGEGEFAPARLQVLEGGEGAGDADGADEPLMGKLCPECGRLFLTLASDGGDAVYQCPHCAAKVRPEPIAPGSVPLATPIEDGE